MTHSDRDLHGDANRDWKDEKATEYAENQRAAFMAGFEAAAREGKPFNQLREWLEEQRDEALERYEEHGQDSDSVRRMTYIEVLVKLSEMGNSPEEDCHE